MGRTVIGFFHTIPARSSHRCFAFDTPLPARVRWSFSSTHAPRPDTPRHDSFGRSNGTTKGREVVSAADELEFYETLRQADEREYLRDVIIPEPFEVRLTCAACPEQWDILIDGDLGYLRCRSSRWRLDYPECGGETLIAEPWHPERGRYESTFDEERPAIFERVFRALTMRVLDRP